MKPPPVTQQPPSLGGTQSEVSVESTQAPHAAGFWPGPQLVGADVVQVVLPALSFSHVYWWLGALPELPLPDEPLEPEEPAVSPAFFAWPGDVLPPLFVVPPPKSLALLPLEPLLELELLELALPFVPAAPLELLELLAPPPMSLPLLPLVPLLDPLVPLEPLVPLVPAADPLVPLVPPPKSFAVVVPLVPPLEEVPLVSVS
jgi:hypothetical protein